jgi:hypothetical protein
MQVDPKVAVVVSAPPPVQAPQLPPPPPPPTRAEPVVEQKKVEAKEKEKEEEEEKKKEEEMTRMLEEEEEEELKQKKLDPPPPPPPQQPPNIQNEEVKPKAEQPPEEQPPPEIRRKLDETKEETVVKEPLPSKRQLKRLHHASWPDKEEEATKQEKKKHQDEEGKDTSTTESGGDNETEEDKEKIRRLAALAIDDEVEVESGDEDKKHKHKHKHKKKKEEGDEEDVEDDDDEIDDLRGISSSDDETLGGFVTFDEESSSSSDEEEEETKEAVVLTEQETCNAVAQELAKQGVKDDAVTVIINGLKQKGLLSGAPPPPSSQQPRHEELSFRGVVKALGSRATLLDETSASAAPTAKQPKKQAAPNQIIDLPLEKKEFLAIATVAGVTEFYTRHGKRPAHEKYQASDEKYSNLLRMVWIYSEKCTEYFRVLMRTLIVANKKRVPRSTTPTAAATGDTRPVVGLKRSASHMQSPIICSEVSRDGVAQLSGRINESSNGSDGTKHGGKEGGGGGGGGKKVNGLALILTEDPTNDVFITRFFFDAAQCYYVTVSTFAPLVDSKEQQQSPRQRIPAKPISEKEIESDPTLLNPNYSGVNILTSDGSYDNISNVCVVAMCFSKGLTTTASSATPIMTSVPKWKTYIVRRVFAKFALLVNNARRLDNLFAGSMAKPLPTENDSKLSTLAKVTKFINDKENKKGFDDLWDTWVKHCALLYNIVQEIVNTH